MTQSEEELRLKEIRRQIYELNGALENYAFHYHTLGKPLVGDDDYDAQYDQLVELEKQYPQYRIEGGITSSVGAPLIDGLKKLEHSSPLLSMSKTFEPQGVLEFLDDPEETIICNGKLDGLALEIVYEDGKLKHAITRGDGLIGEDVTEVVKTIRNVPKQLGTDFRGVLEVRGEVVLIRDAFIRLNEHLISEGKNPYTNARNAVAGILRLTDPKEALDKPLAFFVYGVGRWDDQTHLEWPYLKAETLSAALTNLNRWYGFSFKRYSTYRPKREDRTLGQWVTEKVKAFTELRPSYDIEIDGVVFAYDRFKKREEVGATSNHPRYSIAYKFESSSKVSKLEDVIWQVGRTGVITPVACVSPVEIHGVTISRVTLHNLAEIERLNLRTHDTVLISRQGDVIPKIKSVVMGLRDTNEAREIPIPAECPSCSAPVETDETFAYCRNHQCPAQLVTGLEHFASREAMNIRGLGVALIRVLVDKSLLTNVADIYRLKEDRYNLIRLEGYGPTSIDKLLDEIEKSRNTKMHRFLFALGIPGVGVTTAKAITGVYGNNLQKLIGASVDELMMIDDIGELTAKCIHSFFNSETSLKLVHELLEFIQLDSDNGVNIPMLLVGQTWVVTGSFKLFSRKQWEEIISKLGAKISGSVSTKTTVVLAGEGTENGSKIKTANQLDIRILDELEFKRQLDENGLHIESIISL